MAGVLGDYYWGTSGRVSVLFEGNFELFGLISDLLVVAMGLGTSYYVDFLPPGAPEGWSRRSGVRSAQCPFMFSEKCEGVWDI